MVARRREIRCDPEWVGVPETWTVRGWTSQKGSRGFVEVEWSSPSRVHTGKGSPESLIYLNSKDEEEGGRSPIESGDEIKEVSATLI